MGTRQETILVQKEIRNLCRKRFGGQEVRYEWDVAKKSSDDLTHQSYCPRIDVAVGPFNVDRNWAENTERIRDVQWEYKSVVDRLERLDTGYEEAGMEFNRLLNQNPRCFLAIELERSGSRKHRLGGIINASVLGSIGILVAWDNEVLDHLQKIRKFLRFAAKKKKALPQLANLLVLPKSAFLRSIQQISINAVEMDGTFLEMGLVHPFQLIHTYEQRMKGSNTRYQNNAGLPKVLGEYIHQGEYKRVFGFFSRTSDYHKILINTPQPQLEKITEAGFFTLTDIQGTSQILQTLTQLFLHLLKNQFTKKPPHFEGASVLFTIIKQKTM